MELFSHAMYLLGFISELGDSVYIASKCWFLEIYVASLGDGGIGKTEHRTGMPRCTPLLNVLKQRAANFS